MDKNKNDSRVPEKNMNPKMNLNSPLNSDQDICISNLKERKTRRSGATKTISMFGVPTRVQTWKFERHIVSPLGTFAPLEKVKSVEVMKSENMRNVKEIQSFFSKDGRKEGSYTSLEELLKECDFEVSSQKVHATEYRHGDIIVYTVPIKKINLVISPEDYIYIQGYSCRKYHNSNLVAFSKESNKGKNRIHYGYKIEFDNYLSVKKFLMYYVDVKRLGC